MRAIHLICKQDDATAGMKGLRYDKATRTSRSGQWDIREEDAQALVGGWLYLHPAKAQPSRVGGGILAYEMVTDPTLAHARRVVFTFRPSPRGREQSWRGTGHAQSHSGGLVDATLPHETAASGAPAP